MALKDRDRKRPRRLTRLGIIRLGYKETRKRKDGSEYEFPVQADFFVLRDAPGIAEHYDVPADGVTNDSPFTDKVRELNVLLPFPDIQRNFDGYYTVWAGGVLVCKGDGEYVQYASKFAIKRKKNGDITVGRGTAETHVSDGVAQTDFSWNGEQFSAGDHVPCPGAAHDLYPHCAACRRSSILKVMMADPALFRLGYYQIATGGGSNYDSILGTLEIVSGDGRQPVNGIPFVLRLVERDTTYVDDSNVRKQTKKWFLELEPEPQYTRALLKSRAEQMAGLLTAGAGEEPDCPECEYIDASDEVPPPHAEAGGPAEAAEPEEAGGNIQTIAAFTEAVKAIGITGEDVRKALGGKSVQEWCHANNSDLNAALYEIRQICGK